MVGRYISHSMDTVCTRYFINQITKSAVGILLPQYVKFTLFCFDIHKCSSEVESTPNDNIHDTVYSPNHCFQISFIKMKTSRKRKNETTWNISEFSGSRHYMEIFTDRIRFKFNEQFINTSLK